MLRNILLGPKNDFTETICTYTKYIYIKIPLRHWRIKSWQIWRVHIKSFIFFEIIKMFPNNALP